MGKLGTHVQGRATIPAGTDAYITQRVLTAGDKPILIQAGSWWGGDGGEYITLGLLQPNQIGIGEKEIGHFLDLSNAVVWYEGNLEGGLAVNAARSMFGAYIRQPPGSYFFIPPHCTVVAYASATNTAAWEIIISGFECENYA